MKRIIDIPDELYKKIMGHRALTKYQEHIDYEDLKNMVEDSTPLNECKAEDCIDRKETIEWVENVRILNEHYHPYSKNNYLIDCDTAIDHLKQVSSVYPKKEDYIKANEQLKKQLEMLKLDRACDNSVLEDIKAELNELKSHYMPSSGVVWGIKMCLKIINKHISGKDNIDGGT